MLNSNTIFNTPSFITPVDDNNDFTNMDYIIQKDEFAVLLNAVSDKLMLPATVISFKESDEREDSSLTEILMNYFCEIFRNCAGVDICKICDKNHAMLFNNIDLFKDDLYCEITNRIKKEYHKDRIYDNDKVKPPVCINNDKKRLYLQYNCPISGLLEQGHPIIIENKIVGVLFIGQLHYKSKENDKKILEVRNNFIIKHPNIFDEYILNKPIKKDQIINELLKINEPRDFPIKYKPLPKNENQKGLLGNRNKNIDNDDIFDKLTSSIIDNVLLLEKNLENVLNKKRGLVVKEAVNDTKNKIFTLMRNEITTEDYRMIDFWKTINDEINVLIKKLDLRYISVFAANSSSKKVDIKKLDMVVLAMNETNNDEEDYKYFTKFDYSNINLTENDYFLCTRGIERLSSINLQSCIVKSNDEKNLRIDLMLRNTDIFFYPVRKGLDYSIAFLVGYKDYEHLFSVDSVKNIISIEILELVKAVMLVYYFLLNDLANKNNENVLRIYRHEISHLTLGLRGNNEQLSKPKEFKELNNDKIFDIYNENESSLLQLDFFTRNMGTIINPVGSLDNEEIDIYKDIVLKWNYMFKKDMELTNNKLILLPSKNEIRNIAIDDVSNDDFKIFYDKKKLDQIVYNLISNAIKYSYHYTKIYISIKKDDFFKSHFISVTNYGYKIVNDDSVYELYKRGKDEAIQNKEGSGIGLYVAKTVSERIGATLTHQCELISMFNVPLMKSYLNIAKEEGIIYKVVNKEFSILNKNEIVKEIANNEENIDRINRLEVLEEITSPIYKTVFTLKIPYKIKT